MLGSFLSDCVGLFDDIFNACMCVPIFRFFGAFGLFLAVVSLVQYLVRQGRRGRL